MVAGGGLLVDRDLARPGRPLSGDDRGRVERAVRAGAADRHGRAADRATVCGAQLRPGVQDEPLYVLHLRQRADPGHHGSRHRRRTQAGTRDRALADDNRIGFRVLGREHAVERVRGAVHQHVRAADHRHAEHDRQRRQHRAQLAHPQPTDDDAGHPSSASIALLTSPLETWPSSRTIRPSARIRIRSATVDTRGSCVTVRIVCP